MTRASLIALLLLASSPALAQNSAPVPAPTVPAPTAPAPTAAPAPAPERVTFDVKMRADQGGGRAVGSAGDFEYEDGRFLIATGGVDLKFRDLHLRADRLRIDIPANQMTAEGSVLLDEGPRRLSGSVLEYDLNTRTGRITDALASVDPEYFFRGSEIRKTGPNTYTLSNGSFTSCNQEVPSWSIELSRATITLEEYARIWNARMKFKNLPVFYLPYIIWPATTERTSGFLVPKPGYSERRGPNLSLAYYKTLGRSADATFFADISAEGYNGLGTEFRWAPAEDSRGSIEAYFLTEPDAADVDPRFLQDPIFDPDRQFGDDRWKIALYHESKNLWGGWRGVVDVRQYSDFDYLKDIERSVDRQTQPFVVSNAYLSRNLGPHSFNILIDERDRILGDRSRDLRRQIPEVEYKLRPTKIGGMPLYFKMQSALHYFSVELEGPPPVDPNQERDVTKFDYGRADLLPELSIPFSTLPWLSAKVDLGVRATYYTDSLDTFGQNFSGDSLSRTFPTGSLEVVGPTFSRIFDSPGGRFSKFKHIIEPRFDYVYVGDFDEQIQVPIFDEVDIFRPAHFYAIALVNRFLAKPSDEKEGGAYEIASLEIAQAFNVDDQPGQIGSGGLSTKESAIFTKFRLNPSKHTSFKTDLEYNTLFSKLQSLGLSGSTRWGDQELGLTWFTRWNAETGDTTSDQLRVFTALKFGERFGLDAQLSYDLEASELLNQRYVLNWTSQCYSWQLELREANYRELVDRDYRFSFTLKGIGTFLDLNDSF